MKLALVNGIKQEATKGTTGQCLCCGADVIAKCGKIRSNHWAHKNNKECSYSQKEPKTPWHINWQNCFPENWQEVICKDDKTNEKHIADIKTPNGLVVEFQHSAIANKEQLSRENFYRQQKGMIWVVDGTRNKNDFKRFLKNIKSLHPLINYSSQLVLYSVDLVEEILPPNWLSATVPVYFDFKSDATNDTENEQQKLLRNLIWGFFKIGKKIFAVSMPHNDFVHFVHYEIIMRISKYIIDIYTYQQQSFKISLKSNYRTVNIPSNINPHMLNRIRQNNPRFKF